MTQTRQIDYKSLDIWKSVLNYNDSKFVDIKFIINHQKKSKHSNISIQKYDNFLVVESPFINLSEARNTLLKISIDYYKNYDFYIFLDDDAYIYDFHLFLQSLIYCKINNFSGLIIGSIYKPNLSFINRHMKKMPSFMKLKHNDHNLIMGSCICFGKDLIRKKILFDREFGLGSKYGGSEETDLFFNVLKNRINSVYNQCFIVIHPPTYKNQYSFSKMYQYGTGRGGVYRKYLKSNKIRFITYLIYGLAGNALLSIFGLITFQINFSLRHIGLFLGKLNGFIFYKEK